MAYLEDVGERSKKQTEDIPTIVRFPWSRVRPLIGVAIIIAILLVWARMGNVSKLFFPAPSQIAQTFMELLRDGTLHTNVLASTRRLLLGLLIGGGIGTVIGLLLGWSETLREIFDPIIAALHPIPKVSILPMIIIIFGIGETTKLIVVALSTFFPMLINTMAGVMMLNPTYFDVAKNYGMSRWNIFRQIIIPGSLPMMLPGLRIALNSALVLTIVVELITSLDGVGEMIGFAWRTLRTRELYATLCVIALLGILFNLIVRILTKVLIPWHQERTL